MELKIPESMEWEFSTLSRILQVHDFHLPCILDFNFLLIFHQNSQNPHCKGSCSLSFQNST